MKRPYGAERTEPVKAKKHLGQHFLKDMQIASKIADTLSLEGYTNVLEIGPGTGVLTQFLIKKPIHLEVIDLDSESIAYLREHFVAQHKPNSLVITEGDFLKNDISTYFNGEPFAITGNFPYNISTQIVFKLLEHREQIPEFTGMFQREVAERICEQPGTKAYGILSVLVQAFYEASYAFTVHPQVFEPPPKVQSGVIILRRKESIELDCSVPLFFKVVKTAFNQRRKTLRNSLKVFELSNDVTEDAIFDLRPERLGVAEFIRLTRIVENGTVQTYR
jgi:16S rRNA (adenine1518-N6/adenine1519-N6)-dimethyltransferase